MKDDQVEIGERYRIVTGWGAGRLGVCKERRLTPRGAVTWIMVTSAGEWQKTAAELAPIPRPKGRPRG